MISQLSRRQFIAAGIGTILIGVGGCSDSKPTPTEIINVEEELRKQANPPGSFTHVSIGGKAVQLSAPAIRVQRVVLVLSGELLISYIALRDGDAKTEKIKITPKEAMQLKQMKEVMFIVAGNKADNLNVEGFPIAEVKEAP